MNGWLVRDKRTHRVRPAPVMTLAEQIDERMQLHGPMCLDATRCVVSTLDEVRARDEYHFENICSERISEEVSDASDDASEDEPKDHPVTPPPPRFLDGRCVGVLPRARQDVAACIDEDGGFMAYVLDLLRVADVREIHQAHSSRWATRRTYDSARFFKIEQKVGTCGIVVLVMLDKASDDHALIVSAFRRTHKGGNQYDVHQADVASLVNKRDDCYRELRSACGWDV